MPDITFTLLISTITIYILTIVGFAGAALSGMSDRSAGLTRMMRCMFLTRVSCALGSVSCLALIVSLIFWAIDALS